MNELELVFKNRTMEPATQRSHIQTFNKINSLYTIDRPLHAYSYGMINEMLKIPELSPSYKRKVVSLFIIVKHELTPTDEDLPKLRELLPKLTNEVKDKRVLDFKEEDTDLYDAIKDWIDTLDIDADPVKFIVNYLVFYLNVRNLDLIIKICDRDKYCLETDDKINYLVYAPFEITYYRNTYKTKKSYGTKYNSISDERFIYAVSCIKRNTILLTENTDSIGGMIKRRLYNNMTETDYLHQNITKFEGDVNKLLEIEQNRGTNLKTLMTSYNKSFTNGKK
jgi:hypothetical protein